jgi:hypothetical protein
VCSRAPTGKGYDATTPVHDLLSLCESDPHSPKDSGLLSSTENKGYPQSTSKKNKTTPKPLPAKAGQAETVNKMPRPRSDSYEARSTGRLDHVLTRTRLARRDTSATEKSLTRTTQGQAGRPTSFTNSKTKVRAFNANHQPLPTLMAIATTGMGAVPVSNLTFYRPSQDGR